MTDTTLNHTSPRNATKTSAWTPVSVVTADTVFKRNPDMNPLFRLAVGTANEEYTVEDAAEPFQGVAAA